MKHSILKKLLIINCALLIIFSSCSVSHQLSKSADKILLKDSVIKTGHIGISIYEPATNSYWYNYNATKYFVPASNTKLFTLYAGMKYLGDSLVGLRYSVESIKDSAILIFPTGDPTFLHPDFIKQPVFDLLKRYSYIDILHSVNPEAWGKGWAWNDYNESFMTPRSSFPIYGNLVKIKWITKDSIAFIPYSFYKFCKITNYLTNGFKILKDVGSNYMSFIQGNEKNAEVPFNFNEFATDFLGDTLKKSISYADEILNNPINSIHSQPTDSLFKPMMHRSDNFFAEQTLLMVSNEHLGYMNDEDIIDTLLKTDLKDVPQKPKWVDGCGLSRYNLFTPQSFVYILNKMKNDFGLERLKIILPTGGEGTLKNYYLNDSGYIYAKTGSLSNNASLSGFLLTKKNRQIIFSILVNNFQGDGTAVRVAIEQFIEAIRETY